MSNCFPCVPLGELVASVERAETPIPGKVYRQVGVRLWGEGAYEREPLDGGQTKYKTLNRVECGDIIINKIWARNGSVAVVTDSLAGCLGSGEFPTFVPNRERLAPRWFHWITKAPWFWQACDVASRGTSGKNRIRPEQFLAIPIPLPPLAEQLRIVTKIDALAAQTEEAHRLRREAVNEAEALVLASASVLCFDRFAIRPFGECLTEAKNGIYKPPHFWGQGIPCIRMYNIDGPELNLRKLQLLDVTQEELDTYGCIPGDLVFNRVNSAELVGKTGIIRPGFPQCTFESKNMRLRVLPSRTIPEFAVLVLNSARVRAYYRSVLKQQCGMATLNQKHVLGIPFPEVAVSEQRRIVAEVDALQAEVHRLKALQAETTVELDALLPAILDRAFKGDL